MGAAALVFLVAAVGVEFGWQPMPDGTPHSELLIQIEPEMLDTLARGQSIPIASEVPEGVGPIGRVRVVVGRERLPHGKVETRRKPTGAAAGGDGQVVVTNYNEPQAPRYGTPAAGTSQAAAPVSAGFDPYTQAPPAQTAAPGADWNAAAPPANPLRPAADAVAGAAPGGAWNGDAPATGVADNSDLGPIGRMGAEFQNATAPIQGGFDRFGNQIRTAADRLGDRTGQLLDDLGRPLQPGGILRPGTTAPATTVGDGSVAPPWNAGVTQIPGAGAAPAGTGIGAGAGAVGGGGESNWNGEGAGAPAATPHFSPPYAGGPVAPPLATQGAPPASSAADSDPWANAADPRFRSVGTGSAGSVDNGTVTWGGESPAMPDLPPPPTVGTGQAGTGAGAIANGNTPTADDRAIRSGMLNLPGNRVLDGVDPLAAIPVGTAGAGNIFSPVTAGPPSSGAETLASNPIWGAGAAGTQPASPVTPPPVEAPSDARSKAAVILAWVLLFASFAGNVYLFWSYLDVRTKYRALVRKTARAVGSRFSAA